ncbi:MAG: hypothetical protein GX135_00665 [Candidatus Cloacimonetes bacterium]|nr:hypothetical protein [Candidatus Cloacimonadota bacterium]
MQNYYKLMLKCPKCGQELGDEEKLIDGVPAVKFIIHSRGEEGLVWLSALYGSYNNESTLDVPKGEISSFFCPHCRADLISNTNCNLCQAPQVDLHLFEGGKVSICSRAGCTKHSIEFEDLNTAINHFFNAFELQNRRPR